VTSAIVPDVPRTRRRLPGPALALAMLALAGVGVASVLSIVGGIGPRLAAGRPLWILLAVGLEALSALGFVVVFRLVLGGSLAWRASARMGLVVLAGTVLLPAGGLVAIGLGAKSLRARSRSRAGLARRAVAFLLITNAPNVIVLGVVGFALGTGLLDGPHCPLFTLVPAAVGFGTLGVVLLVPLISQQRLRRPLRATRVRLLSTAIGQLELGVIEARALVLGRNWKLIGAVAYYAFDNAVLWASFRAFGHSDPSVVVFVMAYLIGSAAASLPLPAGIGAVEGGIFGLLVLFGAPALCAGVAVLGYRAVSTGVPLVLGGVALIDLAGRRRDRTDQAKSHNAERSSPDTGHVSISLSIASRAAPSPTMASTSSLQQANSSGI
jgi:uncharacterized membrane protein YbhN (UPF0104 family)